ncbi:MAG: hypothetical protein QNJ81_12600 [Acidimicrobiia bacterium]|nr:hypothetical protein [Acidimicrobiia bacterium]
MKTAETATARYVLRDDGIVTAVELNPELERTEELVAEALDTLEAIVDGVPRPGLWDPRPLVTAFPAGWSQLLDRLEDLVSALAILVDDETPGARGLFPALLDSPYVPVRIFREEQRALDWLAGYVDP